MLLTIVVPEIKKQQLFYSTEKKSKGTCKCTAITGNIFNLAICKSLDYTMNLQALQESGCLKGNANPLSIAATYILGGST